MPFTDYFSDDASSTTKAGSCISSSAIPNERSHLLPASGKAGSFVNLERKYKLWRTREAVMVALLLILFLASVGDQLMDSPQTRIVEAVICYRYYEEADPSKILIPRSAIGPGALGGVAELLCKADAVQQELSSLRGYQQLFDGLPTLILAVPYGWAADRYGRQPILLLGLASFVMRASWIQLVTWFWQSFDVRMTWLSAFYGLLGGGNAAVVALFFVMLSDLTPPAERAAVFLRGGAINIFAGLIMPPVAAWLMKYNPWIPSLMGTVFSITGMSVCATLPETLDYDRASMSTSHPTTPAADAVPDSPRSAGFAKPRATNIFTRVVAGIRVALSFLSEDWRVSVLILPYVGHQLIGTSAQLLLQYCSKRYGMTFSDATLLLTVFNGARTILLFVVLPYFTTSVMRKFTGQRKDLYLTRASLIFMVVGWILIGLAPNIATAALSMVVVSLGQGAFLLLRSFLTSLVPPHHIARVYSVLAIVDVLGSSFGGALLAQLFNTGISLGSGWIGLPFFFIGLLSAGFAIITFVVRLRPGEDEHSSAHDE